MICLSAREIRVVEGKCAQGNVGKVGDVGWRCTEDHRHTHSAPPPLSLSVTGCVASSLLLCLSAVCQESGVFAPAHYTTHYTLHR